MSQALEFKPCRQIYTKHILSLSFSRIIHTVSGVVSLECLLYPQEIKKKKKYHISNIYIYCEGTFRGAMSNYLNLRVKMFG